MKKHVLIAVAAPFLLAGCATVPHNKSNTATKNTVSTTSSSSGYIGHVSLKPEDGKIGTTVTATASGLPANTSYKLVWQTIKASWNLTGQYKETFSGRNLQPVNKVLKTVKSNSQGQVDATFSVPDGFGFNHTVYLEQAGTKKDINQALFNVDPQVSLSTNQGPQGSPIEISMKGIGAESYTNNWMLLYDHKFTGWISSVTTNGTAHFTIPATGTPGKHIIDIIHGAYTFPYLNTKQSPHPKPEFHLVYTVTKGKAILPKQPSVQALPMTPGKQPSGTGTAAWVSPASGPANQPLVIHARNLPADKTVTIRWFHMVGSHVTAAGYSLKKISLGSAAVSNDGTLTYRVTPPSDLGGSHSISIVDTTGKVLASTKYTVTPSASSISPARGPVGTTFTVHIKGVGWTDTSNIYTVDYDNSYIGYACGFNSQGDVQIPIKATGKSGWHYITLYPAIYKGQDIKGTDAFRLPQLTYASDHPGEKLPAFHFAFYVTDN